MLVASNHQHEKFLNTFRVGSSENILYYYRVDPSGAGSIFPDCGNEKLRRFAIQDTCTYIQNLQVQARLTDIACIFAGLEPKGPHLPPTSLESNFRSVSKPKAKRLTLSLDGGGVRGYHEILLLKAIEEAFLIKGGKLRGKSIVEEFDLVVGTSSSGIIAASLAVKPAKSLLETEKLFDEFMIRTFSPLVGESGSQME